MFNKLVRESGGVYKAEYERDRLSRDWHPEPCWSWFVFIAGDSECKMWGFLPVNHRFKGGYGFLGLDRACLRRRGRHLAYAKKPLTYFLNWTSLRLVSSPCAVHGILSFGWHLLCQTACGVCPEGASLSEEKITADAPVCLEPPQADSLKWAALGAADGIRCFPVCGWCLRVWVFSVALKAVLSEC